MKKEQKVKFVSSKMSYVEFLKNELEKNKELQKLTDLETLRIRWTNYVYQHNKNQDQHLDLNNIEHLGTWLSSYRKKSELSKDCINTLSDALEKNKKLQKLTDLETLRIRWTNYVNGYNNKTNTEKLDINNKKDLEKWLSNYKTRSKQPELSKDCINTLSDALEKNEELQKLTDLETLRIRWTNYVNGYNKTNTEKLDKNNKKDLEKWLSNYKTRSKKNNNNELPQKVQNENNQQNSIEMVIGEEDNQENNMEIENVQVQPMEEDNNQQNNNIEENNNNEVPQKVQNENQQIEDNNNNENKQQNDLEEEIDPIFKEAFNRIFNNPSDVFYDLNSIDNEMNNGMDNNTFN